MPNYKRKLMAVDAVQWTPDLKLPNLELIETKIHYSEDGSLFYITRAGCRPEFWLEMTKKPGLATEEDKKGTNFFNNFAQLTDTKTGETYCRKVLYFSFWKVRSGKEEPIDEESDLFKDYASLAQWSAEKQVMAYLRLPEYKVSEVRPGDWLITDENKNVSVCPKADFENLYEPL